MLTLSFINQIVTETSTSSTAFISSIIDSYYENLLKAQSKGRQKFDHLSGKCEVMESTDISNISIKELLSQKKTKQELKQFLEKQVINHLLQLLGMAKLILKKAVVPVMLLLIITRKVIHLCTITRELLIWRIKLYVSWQMILMYLLLCLATMKN